MAALRNAPDAPPQGSVPTEGASDEYVRTTLNLPEPELAAVKELANDLGLTMSTVIRLLIDSGLTLREKVAEGYTVELREQGKDRIFIYDSPLMSMGQRVRPTRMRPGSS